MKKIILGTDWWSDCDDAVALRLVTRAAKERKIELLGVCINACMDYSVASLRGFLEADGIYNIPLGIDRSAIGYEGLRLARYQKRLAMDFAPDVTNDDADTGVRLYRRLLAEAVGKVEIMEIGFLGVLNELLLSGGDDISEKSGLELVRSKVQKIWVMGGKWDEDGGLEHNFSLNERTRSAAHDFCILCPVPVTFLGFEVGLGVITGGGLDKNDHLFRVMNDYNAPDGRHSWDPMLVMMALIGDEKDAGYTYVSGTASVDADTGANHFALSDDGMHRFVRKKHAREFYEDQINAYL